MFLRGDAEHVLVVRQRGSVEIVALLKGDDIGKAYRLLKVRYPVEEVYVDIYHEGETGFPGVWESCS